MKLLYLTGTEAELDSVTTQQLARIAPQLSVTTVGSAAEALVEIRRMGGFHALLTSPSLARNETLALITSLRTDRVPIAIVPVVGETHQDFLASAIGAGADDVLVLRGDTLVQPTETLTRIRQSPHLFPGDDRRLRVLYAGSDAIVWDLLEQLAFVRAEHAVCTVDGACHVRMPGSGDGSLRCDVVLIDEKPGEAHPLQVVKSVKAQASDLPVVILSPTGPNDFSTAAFDLGADDAVQKTSAYRRRLVATLRRVHQRLELTAQHTSLREREARLRQIVETMPEGLTVISGDGTVLAMNAAGLMLVGAARPREVVGRDFCDLVVPDARSDVRQVLEAITAGDAAAISFDLEGVDGSIRRLELRGVRLERDARGGRGVIATLTPAGSGAANLSGTEAADALERERALESALGAAEGRLRDLDKELREAEGHRFKLDAALAAERSKWAQERAELEVKSQEALRAAAESVNVQGAIEEARGDLERAHRQHEEDRRAWDAARASLQSHLQEQIDAAGRVRTEHESALSHSHEERDRERAGWDAARRTLEDRVSELRVAWDSARQDAEARRQETQSHDSARAGLESDLDAARRELASEREAHARARREWEESQAHHDARARDLVAASAGHAELRAALDRALEDAEARASEADTARDEKTELETTLDAAQGLLRQTAAEHKDERAKWEAERRDLEARLQRLADTAQGHAALGSTLESVRGELEQARQAIDAERARTTTAAGALDAERAQWAEERARWESERAGARAERDQLEQARGAERSQLDSLRAELGQRDARHAADRTAWDNQRRGLEAKLADIEAVAGTRLQLDATLEAVRAELRDVQAAYSSDRAAWERTREEQERARHEAEAARLAEQHRAEGADRRAHELQTRLDSIEQERAKAEAARAGLEQALADLRAAHGEVAAARMAALGESSEARQALERVRDELGQVQRKLEQEHTRRALLEAAVREARKDAEGRLSTVEAEFTSVRGALERDLADAVGRIEQLTAESQNTRTQLEQQIAVQSEGYDRLLGNTLFGYAVTTPDGLLIRCNDMFARLFGYLNARDAQTKTAGRPFPPLAGRTWLDARLAAEGRIDQFESTLERIDGRTIRVLESAVILSDSSGQQVVERTLVDRTGSFAQGERLRHADRLEEVGTLVAAMAPDIESLLASVVSSGHELSDTMPAADARREHTARILSHAAQAGDLVRQLAAFSVKHVRPSEPLDLADAVRHAERVLRPLIGPHVNLKLRLNRTDAVSVSQDDLDQLLSALVVAGRDLLPIGGTLTIETTRVEVNDAEADPAVGLRPGAHLQLAIIASGYGVQAAQRTASLDAVAGRCGGHLRVASEAGRSASLRVYFPRWPGIAGPMA
jgi:PAS domain S-box-containing protein